MLGSDSSTDELHAVLIELPCGLLDAGERDFSGRHPQPFRDFHAVAQMSPQLFLGARAFADDHADFPLRGRMRLNSNDGFARVVSEQVVPAVNLIPARSHGFIEIKAVGEGTTDRQVETIAVSLLSAPSPSATRGSSSDSSSSARRTGVFLTVFFTTQPRSLPCERHPRSVTNIPSAHPIPKFAHREPPDPMWKYPASSLSRDCQNPADERDSLW